jgi:ribosomal protein S3AE
MVDEVNNKQAAKNAAKSAADLKKQKKKKWCPIVAPEMFNNRVIGESLLDDASQLMGKAITVNMMQLTGDMKKQNMNIMFKVIDVKEGKGITQAVRFELSPSSIRRLAKREKDKLSDSFVVKTEDGKLVRIKPVMITNNLTKGSVSASLIRTCRAICKEFVNKMKLDNLMSDLVSYKFQKDVRDALHITYPLRSFDVRVLALETKKKKESVEEEELLKIKRQRELAEAEKKEAEEAEQKSQDQTKETYSEEFSDQTEETEDTEQNEDSDDAKDSDEQEQ